MIEKTNMFPKPSQNEQGDPLKAAYQTSVDPGAYRVENLKYKNDRLYVMVMLL
jgi:hypothetical protein